jgi:5-formyltetrahydrofolate cyclo-ligase
LEKDAYGIDIPLASAAPITPQLILVPLLAFDLRGQRLGYVGGYYDRTLARLRQVHPGIRTLGIAYASQQANSLPDEETDMRLDGIATEQGILIPKGTL